MYFIYALNEELLNEGEPEQARNAERILSVNYQHRGSNVTLDRADLIDGAS
jgi:hypothetical protein